MHQSHLIPAHGPTQALLPERLHAHRRQLPRPRFGAKLNLCTTQQRSCCVLNVFRLGAVVERLGLQEFAAPDCVRAAEEPGATQDLQRRENHEMGHKELGVDELPHTIQPLANVRGPLNAIHTLTLELGHSNAQRPGIGMMISVVDDSVIRIDLWDYVVEIRGFGLAVRNSDASERPGPLADAFSVHVFQLVFDGVSPTIGRVVGAIHNYLAGLGIHLLLALQLVKDVFQCLFDDGMLIGHVARHDDRDGPRNGVPFLLPRVQIPADEIDHQSNERRQLQAIGYGKKSEVYPMAGMIALAPGHRRSASCSR
mmetsp:Transcript_64625/g.173054  ORF Transcript_64625/g.173054 Transcript_64625/m.173054 type:complete len:311 (+) Transcript_64625:893-1825(+)